MSTDSPAAPAGRIALIRHGQTQWSASGRHTSDTDVELTAHGEVQARTLPVVLSGLNVAPVTVLASPRRRAEYTARLAGFEHPSITDDLVEWRYGDYEGLTTPQIRAKRPGWDLFRDGCPSGESPQEVGVRADVVLHAARFLLERGDVALVCHGHISRVLAVRWVGLPVAAAALIAMDAAAVTVLGTYHGREIIEHANVVPFAPAPAPATAPDGRA